MTSDKPTVSHPGTGFTATHLWRVRDVPRTPQTYNPFAHGDEPHVTVVAVKVEPYPNTDGAGTFRLRTVLTLADPHPHSIDPAAIDNPPDGAKLAWFTTKDAATSWAAGQIRRKVADAHHAWCEACATALRVYG
jgi:hypothetical protein